MRRLQWMIMFPAMMALPAILHAQAQRAIKQIDFFTPAFEGAGGKRVSDIFYPQCPHANPSFSWRFVAPDAGKEFAVIVAESRS